MVAAVPRLLLFVGRGWSEVRKPLRRPRTLVLLTVDRHADRHQLAALRLCGDQRAHPRRQPRLLSQSAGERPARPFHPQGAAVVAAMDRGRDCRGRDLGACRRARSASCGSASPCASASRPTGCCARSRRSTRSPGWRSRPRLLFPLGDRLARLAARGRRSDLRRHGSVTALLVAAAGIVSTTPLLLFTAAARRLPYSTLGMLQFLAPTLQFLFAVWLYGEPFTTAPMRSRSVRSGRRSRSTFVAIVRRARASVALPE